MTENDPYEMKFSEQAATAMQLYTCQQILL